MKNLCLQPAVRIALLYAFFAGLWILLSDHVLAMLTADAHLLIVLQNYKDWAFVVVMIGFLYLEYKQAGEKLRRTNQALEMLGACRQALVHATTESDLLHEICKLIVDVGGYQLAWVGFVQQDAINKVYPVAQAGSGATRFEPINITRICTEQSRDFTSTAIHTSRPCIAKNILGDLVYASRRAKATSVVALPLIADVPPQTSKHPLGTLSIYSERPDAFGAEEVNLLVELANDLAYSIATLHTRAENREAEEAAKRLKADLRRTGELASPDATSRAMISTLDLGAVLQLLVTQVKSALNVKRVFVLLYDTPSVQPGGELVFAAVAGPGSEEMVGKRVPATAGIAGQVIQTGQARLVCDAQDDTLLYKGINPTSELTPLSIAVAPLVAQGAICGAIEAINNAQDKLTEHDLETLEAMADSAAIAIQNARLYQAEHEQHKLAETLCQVGATLVATQDESTVLEHLLELVSQEVPNDAANVMFIEDDFVRIARWRGYERSGVAKPFVSFAPPVIGLPALQQVIGTGKPMVIPDTRTDPSWTYLPEMKWVCSHAAAPIRTRGQVIGLLNVDSATPGFFRQRHAERLQMFADQAVIALENAWLFHRLKQETERLELLYRLGRQLAERMDVRQVAQRALDNICAVTGALRGAVLVRTLASTDDSGSLRLMALTGYDEEPFEAVQQRIELKKGEGLAGWVLTHHSPALVNDVAQDERWLVVPRLDNDIRSALYVPLLSGDEPVGVLNLGSNQEAFFNEDHRRLVESAAATVAVAIANARLHQAEREQFRRLQQSQAQLIHAEKMSALGRLVASITHEISNPLQAVQNSLSLANEELASSLRQEKLMRYLGMAEKEIDRIVAMVCRMRDFYRPARQELQPTDVRALLNSVLDLTTQQLQHSNIVVECEWGDRLPLIQANPDHLKQVFLNLILNAIDAMDKKGGKLCIRADWDQMPACAGQSGQPRPIVRIEFSDTGVGMPPEVVSRLFEPFFTTKRSGTGLGLSISYGIIEAHGGCITATSQEGIGTTFTIRLPVGEA